MWSKGKYDGTDLQSVQGYENNVHVRIFVLEDDPSILETIFMNNKTIMIYSSYSTYNLY